MDNDDICEFVHAMELIDPNVVDYTDALVVAMQHISPRPQARYFGAIGTGVFYTDTDWENTRWFSEMNTAEAANALVMEFGDGFTDDLR